MRSVAFILLLCPIAIFAQSDSLQISFSNDEIKLNKGQEAKLINFLSKGRIKKVRIIGFIAEEGNISQNRIDMEYRLRNIRIACLENGTNSNEVRIRRKLVSDKRLFNTVLVISNFLVPKSDELIYKTDIVEISEINLIKLPVTKPIKREESQKPISKPKPEIKRIAKKDTSGFKWFDPKEFIKDQRIVIRNLQFQSRTSYMEKSSYPIMKELLRLLRLRPTMVIQLQGHVCCARNGEELLDWRTDTPYLSKNRAKMVYDYLVEHGIARARLSAVGFGSKYKIADDRHDFKARALNRRVEIYVVTE